MDDVEYFTPSEDHFLDHPDQRWPAWKFDMEMHDLFNSLPQRFNSMTIPILDRDAFSRDVIDISHQAQDRPEFDSLLAERMDSRRKELLKLWMKAFINIAGNPSLLDEHKSQYHDSMHIGRYKSFDTYVRYFAGFLNPNSEATSHTQALPDRDHSALPAESVSPALSATGDEASPSTPISAPSPRQKTKTRSQSQDSRGRVSVYRRRNQATMRSSDGIQKAGERKGLGRSSRREQDPPRSTGNGIGTRSSSRLRQKRQSKEQSDHTEPPPTSRIKGDTGKRKRGQEEHYNSQPLNTEAQPNTKKRRTGSTASATLQHERKKEEERLR
ncbi:hypothetical protein VM1G_10911 [Cytospora mali]|uniref:Uncharacterized protein n=1 Tax=Cytospora mali TaxID=578113 RepID=A0A194VIZ9_CYTMA|nr:hypothetical protein VM1G_10911 [Valsa mali]